MKQIFTLFIALTLLSSCKDETPTSQSSESAVSDSNKNLSVEKIEGCESKDALCKRLKITYPDFKKYGTDLQPVIDDYMRVYISDFLITDKPLEAKNFKDFITQSADAIIEDKKDASTNYNFFFDFTEMYNNGKLLCIKNVYKVEDSDMTENGTGYTIFDQMENEILQIPQILKQEDAVKGILLKELKNRIGIPLDTNLEEEGFYISDLDFAVTNNIGINNKEVIFTYLPLEIAPENRGMLSFSIDKDMIKPYLKDDFVKKWENQ